MVTIGQIVRVHGVHGELKVMSLTDVPRRFEELTEVTVTTPSGGQQVLAVCHTRRTARGYLVTFKGISTLGAAAPLVGSLLQIPQEQRAPLPDGRYYECDLLGMEVRTEEGAEVGTIAEILPTGSNAVFVVQGPGGVEHLIPGTREVVRMVDVLGRRMTVRQVAGLFDAL